MAAACDFDAIPRSITSAGSVRFFPRVSGFTKPIVTYDWDFGDGTSHSAKPTPIHAYPVVTVPTTYTVTLVVTASDGVETDTTAHTNYIRSDAAANVSAPPNDGTYPVVSVLIYDDTNAMMVNRNPWTGCHLYLLYPKTVDSIDKIGTATFSLLDIGDSSATEKSLMAEKKNIVFVLGKTIIYSGKIRRITQNTQAGFDTTTRVKLWDVECDSDLAKLQMVNIDSSVLQADGAPLYDTPGNIARKILTQTSPARDIFGVINCVDSKVVYQLNSTTVAEQAGNQYDHMMALAAQNNYDLRSRADFLLYNYTAFDGSTIITNSGAGWTVSEFVGMYAFFVGRDAPVSKNFTTAFATSTSEILVTTASTFFAVNDRVTLSSTGTLPTGLTATTYYVKTVTSDHLTLSTSIGGATVTFSSNGTGTHSLILAAETSGVKTYGKITANTATTITCAAMVGAASAPQSLGYFLIYRGYLIDFAHDLSQPVAIDNLDVNKDVFQFADNDDKRKLSTKIVATGKDLQGKTISVAVSGVHAWNAEDQFFEDSTTVTLLSEGYIYKNTVAPDAVPVTVVPTIPDTTYAWQRAGVGFYDELDFVGTGIRLYDAMPVVFSNSGGALPSPLVAGTTYYVRDTTTNLYFYISATPGGTRISLTDAGTGTHYVYTVHTYWRADKLVFSDGDMISTTGTTAPTGGGFGGFGGFQWTYGVSKDGAGGGVFYIANPAGTAIIDPTTSGTGVYVYDPGLLQNTGYTTGAPTTLCYIWLYGWGYVIPSGTVMAIVWGSSYRSFTTSGTPTEQIGEDGTLITRILLTSGDMLVQNEDFSNRAFAMAPRLYVDDNTRVGTNEVLIGEEKITITAINTDTTYGDYIDLGAATARVTSSTLKCYPHGVGALVARTNYDEGTPQALSPVAAYGLYIDNRTVDNNITYGTLDAYATSLLVGLGNFYKKATTWGPLILAYIPQVGEYYGGLAQPNLSIPPRPSDRLNFTEYTGATPTEYQIVAVTIDCDRMTVTLELGDFEKNVFTSLQQSTNAVNRTLT